MSIEFKKIDRTKLVEDLCYFLANKQIIQSLKEKEEIISTILKISEDCFISGIRDILRYCEDALINFYAYSKELTEKDTVTWAWASKTSYPMVFHEYDLYTSKKIETAYIRNFYYFTINDLDFLEWFKGSRTYDFELKRKIQRVKNEKKDIGSNDNTNNSNNSENSNISNSNNSYSDNGNNSRSKLDKNNNKNKNNSGEQYYARWFWNDSYKDNEKVGWIEFCKSECEILEDAYENGLSFVYINEIKYNVNKMCSKNEDEKYPSKYLLRKPKFEPLKYYKSLSKDKYRLLKRKLKKFLSNQYYKKLQIQQQLKQQKQLESAKTKVELSKIESLAEALSVTSLSSPSTTPLTTITTTTKITLSPCLQITLESLIQKILNNNDIHRANQKFI